MEARINRGRILREILKQDRLTPKSIEFQLAWLTALNAGQFDGLTPEQMPDTLALLESKAGASNLGLESSKADWQNAVKAWLAVAGTGEPAP